MDIPVPDTLLADLSAEQRRALIDARAAQTAASISGVALVLYHFEELSYEEIADEARRLAGQDQDRYPARPCRAARPTSNPAELDSHEDPTMRLGEPDAARSAAWTAACAVAPRNARSSGARANSSARRPALVAPQLRRTGRRRARRLPGDMRRHWSALALLGGTVAVANLRLAARVRCPVPVLGAPIGGARGLGRKSVHAAGPHRASGLAVCRHRRSALLYVVLFGLGRRGIPHALSSAH